MTHQFSLFTDTAFRNTETESSDAQKNASAELTHFQAGYCHQELITLPEDGVLIFITSLFNGDYADQLYQTLQRDICWAQDSLRIAGKLIPIPRLQAWYGDSQADYQYSGLKLTPRPFIEPLETVRKAVTQISNQLLPAFGENDTPQKQIPYNSVLCNFYRNERDSVGWHSDDEAELGTNPVIASVSFGASRSFQLKHKRHKKMLHTLLLPHNSLLIMSGNMQHHWYHQVPKSTNPIGPRVNLTFRNII